MSTRLKKVETLATGFYKPSLPLIPVVELRCDRAPQSRNPKATRCDHPRVCPIPSLDNDGGRIPGNLAFARKLRRVMRKLYWTKRVSFNRLFFLTN